MELDPNPMGNQSGPDGVGSTDRQISKMINKKEVNYKHK